jgi:hypothetical protein
MTKINWPKEPVRQPTKKEKANFNNWVRYLSDSRLSQSEIYSRAADFASKGEKPKNDL